MVTVTLVREGARGFHPRERKGSRQGLVKGVRPRVDYRTLLLLFLPLPPSLPFELQSSPSSPHGFSAFDERARLTTRWDVGRSRGRSKSLSSFPSLRNGARNANGGIVALFFSLSRLKFNLESCRLTPPFECKLKITVKG